MFSDIFIYFKIVQSSKFRLKVKSRILSWVTSEVQSYQVVVQSSVVPSWVIRTTELGTTQLGNDWTSKVTQLKMTKLQKFNNDIII